ncbi:KR domain-containing protein [Streptomyces sp. FXJ1.4098]|nr:KR domain-containing protein [Streptomyces sp. FXJ1.4098]
MPPAAHPAPGADTVHWRSRGHPAWTPRGTVLITGGTGALGSRVAHRIAEHHPDCHLLLVSRRGPSAPAPPRSVTSSSNSAPR